MALHHHVVNTISLTAHGWLWLLALLTALALQVAPWRIAQRVRRTRSTSIFPALPPVALCLHSVLWLMLGSVTGDVLLTLSSGPGVAAGGYYCWVFLTHTPKGKRDTVRKVCPSRIAVALQPLGCGSRRARSTGKGTARWGCGPWLVRPPPARAVN